jgi:hypothetical protein
MKAPEAQALLTNLLTDAAKACDIAKTAARNSKSLAGDNPYGNRFHAVTVALSTAESKLQPVLQGLELAPADLEGFNRHLALLKSTNARPKDRAGSLKELRLLCESVIGPKLDGMTASPIPATEQVLPLSVVEGTRRQYLVQVVTQANGCYEHQWYDACSVMIRRLVETLIIEVYEAKGDADEIKKDGDFLLLNGLIDHILKKTAWGLQRETKTTLPLLKSLGDRSAHSRRYLAKKQDIDKVTHGLRVVAEDLILLAGLK